MILDMYLYLCRLLNPLVASLVVGLLYGGMVLLVLLCLSMGETDFRYFNI